MRKTRILLTCVILTLLLGIETQLGTSVRAGSYDRDAAVDHADTYAHDRAPNYPNYGTGQGCVDCTNYASQVLHQGVFLKSKGTMMSGIGITIGIGGMVGEDPRLGPLLIG